MHGKPLGLFSMLASALGLGSDTRRNGGPGIKGKKPRGEPYKRVLDCYGNPARKKNGKRAGKKISNRRSYRMLPKSERRRP